MSERIFTAIITGRNTYLKKARSACLLSTNRYALNKTRKTVMPTVTLQEARATLPDLIHRLVPGEEVTIIENGRVVGRLLPGESPSVKQTRQLDSMKGSEIDVAPDSSAANGLRPPPGLGKGCITIVSDDDDHLVDFADYMP
jgi:antitoxin (DNA-binding transcriptional repressor) of toxin-antitoxin stability system